MCIYVYIYIYFSQHALSQDQIARLRAATEVLLGTACNLSEARFAKIRNHTPVEET